MSAPQMPQRPGFLTLFFGGILPIAAFALIEEYYGVIAGLVAAMAFGGLEISYELWRYKKVSKMTLITNTLILVLGGLSLLSSEGIWFKLQPALFAFGFALFLIASSLFKKPFLLTLAKVQLGEMLNPRGVQFISGLNWRLGIVFILQSLVGVWSALAWSTKNWALLKTIGMPVSLILYLGLEILVLRLRYSTKD